MRSEDEQQHAEAARVAALSSGKLRISPPRIAEEDRTSGLPAPSVAQLQAESEEVEQGVRELLDRQRHGILRAISKFLLFAVVPLVVLTAIRQVSLGRVTVWFWIEVVAVAVATAACLDSRFSVKSRALTLAFCGTVMATVSLFHFGPFMGTAFVYVGSMLFAALLLESREAYIATALLALGIWSRALTVATGVEFFGPGELVVTPAQWFRLSASSTVGLFALLFIVLRVQSHLWDSLANQIALRIREKKFVEEREKMMRTAGSVQRLESLGRLAGGIAHDFNNSLVVIQCGLDSLDDELPPSERQEVLSEVNDGVTRAATTARQLLSFAKRSVEEIGSCDPRVVAERISKDAGRLLPVNVKLDLKLPESGHVPHVALAEASLEQLVLILVQNAQEAFGESAGKINLTLEQDDATNGLCMVVSDNGPGMDAETLERVWEPFFTTKGDKHAGLGLSTVWATVRRHGGQLGIKSNSDGTTVELSFPPAPEPPVTPREAPSVAPVSLKMSEMRVLVLEDEAPIRAALRRILKTTGLQVEEAETVAAARELMESKTFSLLISDGVLPDGGAGAFIRDFGKKQRAPVILCSGYLEEDLALEGIARGKCSFLPKPFTAEELSGLVRSVLAS